MHAAAMRRWRPSWAAPTPWSDLSSLDGPTALGQTAEDQMGRIVNIASQAGQGGDRAEAMSYGATKAALINPT